MMTNIFAVILNWNGINDTIDCVESIKRMRLEDFQLNIVIIDNGSKPDEIRKLKKLSGVILIKNKKNFGYAGGNNVGIKYALKNNADYLLILNNDTVVNENLISEFIKAAKQKSDAGIFSPKIYFASGFEFHKKRYQKPDLGKVIWYAGGKMDWNNVYGSNKGVDEIDNGQYNKSTDLDFATGACMFLRTDIFKKVGLFDERYFLYLEDADLSLRAKKAGYKVWFIPKATLWHRVSQSSAIGSELNDYYITRNRLLFGITYAPLSTKFALVKESIKLLLNGRKWQKIGIRDFYFGRFGKGSWPPARRENEN